MSFPEGNEITPPRDRRTPQAASSRATLSDALARCRAELEARIPVAVNDGIALTALESLRAPVAEFAKVASLEKLPPERALAMFKKMIGQLADIDRVSPDQRAQIHQRLVEMAIEAYYGGKVSGRRGRLDSAG